MDALIEPLIPPAKHPGLDNHAMGTIFEELVRRFNEANNEEAGEHWTPRDAVRLMAKLVFLPIADEIESGTSGIERAIQYFHAIRDYLTERKSPHRAIVAFSGEPEYGGVKVTEASLNGFPSGQIADKIQEDPYRFLICADKFQTGYDEPLLHTMYVDKVLSGKHPVELTPSSWRGFF